MLNDRLVVLDATRAMVGVDDGRLAAHDVATHIGRADDQWVRTRTSSTASTWIGQWKC